MTSYKDLKNSSAIILFVFCIFFSSCSSGYVWNEVPKFIKQSKLNIARCLHSAILLPNGNVFIVGGNRDYRKQAEIYYPDSNTFELVRQKSFFDSFSPRLFDLKNGKILILDIFGSEVFDTSSFTYIPVGKTGQMNFLRDDRFNASALPSGNVVIWGGGHASL